MNEGDATAAKGERREASPRKIRGKTLQKLNPPSLD